MSKANDIAIEFDEVNQHYYVVWEPIIIAMAKTKQKVLEDLRQTAHFGIDTWIDMKLKDLGQRKEA